jgi:hypothetical protein
MGVRAGKGELTGGGRSSRLSRSPAWAEAMVVKSRRAAKRLNALNSREREPTGVKRRLRLLKIGSFRVFVKGCSAESTKKVLGQITTTLRISQVLLKLD